MATYHRVYDSRHLRLTDKDRDQIRNPTLGSRVRATLPLRLTSNRLQPRRPHRRYVDAIFIR